MRIYNKYIIILICMLFCSVSCLKKDDSSTSSIAGSINNKIYYYKICKSQYICKFECDEDTDITALWNQNVNIYCSKLDAANTTTIKSQFSDDIQQNIIEPIIAANTLELLTVDHDLYQRFDKKFSRFSNLSDYSERDAKTFTENCTESCEQSRAGGIINSWKKIKVESDIIYQHPEGKLLSRLQWSQPLPNPDDPTKFTMSYEQADRACKNYVFNNKYSGWSLPNPSDLEEAVIKELAKAINQTSPNFKITSKDFAWTNSKEYRQLVIPWNSKAKTQSNEQENSNYAICSKPFTYTAD